MKAIIENLIRNYVREYEKRPDVSTCWGEPLVGFANANHPEILKFKTVIGPSHLIPADILPDAAIVIAYFVPLTRETAQTNRLAGEIASPEWALAYEETNAMFRRLNDFLINEISKMGYHGKEPSEAFTFDQDKLISNWSQRHFARIAGLGTFGVNNMLITRKGCCGRYGTIVTDLPVEPDQPLKEEYCIYKKNGRCGVCISRCPSGALTSDGFNRAACYGICQKNARRYTGFGSSYFNGTDETQPNSPGSDVCGKCTAGVPCSFL